MRRQGPSSSPLRVPYGVEAALLGVDTDGLLLLKRRNIRAAARIADATEEPTAIPATDGAVNDNVDDAAGEVVATAPPGPQK